MNKRLALLLIPILTASSLIMAKPAFAQIPKPSVPEFTVKFIDASYYTPTTYSIDPYTGKNVTHPSYYVANKTIIVSIKNQPFVSTYDSSGGWNTSLLYNIRIKGHFTENWTNLYLVDDLPAKSNSDYTVFSYVSEQPNCENTYILGDIMTDFPAGAQVDFQVEAMNGYVHRVFNPNATNQLEMYPYEFTGEESGWSNTQTITINTNDATTLFTSPSPSSPTPTPTSSESPSPSENTSLFSLSLEQIVIIILSATVVVLLVVVAVLLRRISMKPEVQPNNESH
jgi:hypothetical protein